MERFIVDFRARWAGSHLDFHEHSDVLPLGSHARSGDSRFDCRAHWDGHRIDCRGHWDGRRLDCHAHLGALLFHYSQAFRILSVAPVMFIE